MKVTGLFFALIVLISCASDNTAQVNQEFYSDYEEQTIMLGEINWDGLTKDPYAKWFNPNYLHYQVDSITLAPIADKMDDIEIVVFMGTWCEDSQAQVPQFYKILDHLHFSLGNMQVMGIDKSADGLIITPAAAEYKIEKVPTFIFYRDGHELGRITEYPLNTIEKDMAGIIGG